MFWGFFGKCTFFSAQGNKSLVDYTLVDDSFFKNLDSLIVKPLSYLGDHCQVVTSIKFNNKYGKPAVNTGYQWVSLPKFFKWNSQTSPKEYLDALNSPHYMSKIGNFTSAIFPENREGIEQANKILTDIICGAAKVSLLTKRIKKYKTHKPKKWFDKNCKKARKLFKQAANKANMLPSEPSYAKEKTVELKEFKKICKIQQNKFWDNRID